MRYHQAPLSLPNCNVVRLIRALPFFQIRSRNLVSIFLNHLLGIHIGELWKIYRSCGAHTILIRFTLPTTDSGSLHHPWDFTRCLSSRGVKFSLKYSVGSGDIIIPRYLKVLTMAIWDPSGGRDDTSHPGNKYGFGPVDSESREFTKFCNGRHQRPQ